MKDVTVKLLKIKEELETHKLSKGEYAKKANGRTICDPTDSEAACLCLLGAVMRVYNIREEEEDEDTFDGLEAITYLEQATGGTYSDERAGYPNRVGGLYEYNDLPTTTKQDVLNLVDAAIALSKVNV